MDIKLEHFDQKPNILIVDDEQSIRDMLKRHFRFLGYEVDESANGKEAIEVMNSKRFEVVISDISMPQMNGIEFLKIMKKEYPMTHFIIITGYVTMKNILACMRYGADTCIFKPIEDMTELETAVKSAVEHLKEWQVKLKTLLKMKPEE